MSQKVCWSADAVFKVSLFETATEDGAPIKEKKDAILFWYEPETAC